MNGSIIFVLKMKDISTKNSEYSVFVTYPLNHREIEPYPGITTTNIDAILLLLVDPSVNGRTETYPLDD